MGGCSCCAIKDGVVRQPLETTSESWPTIISASALLAPADFSHVVHVCRREWNEGSLVLITIYDHFASN